MAMSPAIIALLACMCLMVLVGLTVGIYFAINGGEEETAGTPATSSTPTLPSGSIKLIDSEKTFDNTNADFPVANQPSGLSYDKQPVQFTISFRLKLTGDSSSWREILQNFAGNSWTDNKADLAGNSPLIFVGPSGDSNFKNRVGFRMMLSNNDFLEAKGLNNPLTINQWYHITCVADNDKLRLYINGQMANEATVPAGQTIRYRNVNNFVWNPNPWGDWTPVVVKDAYWWPRALTSTEVSTLVSTTSTYMPQPLSMGTSAYAKEMYMNY
jgi:hypothetical protein